jgi:hypothetical protein
MNKWLELLLGLILVIAPIVVAFLYLPSFWTDAGIVLKGGVFWAIVGLGALFILLGISDLKG